MECMELLKTRRTYRRFDQARPVPPEVVEEMARSLQYASSAANRQPLSFIIVEDPGKVDAVFEQVKWAGYLPPEVGTPKEGEHPVLFVAVLADLSMKNGWTGFDEGLAVSNLTLAAWNHGVGSCIMGAIDRPKIMEILGVDPEKYELSCVTAFGYPAHESRIEEVAKGESIRYYLDENCGYVVPKYRLEDFVTRQ